MEEIKALMTFDTVSKCDKECPAFYIYSWHFIALTGMRRGEVYGLQWDELNERIERYSDGERPMCLRKTREKKRIGKAALHGDLLYIDSLSVGELHQAAGMANAQVNHIL